MSAFWIWLDFQLSTVYNYKSSFFPGEENNDLFGFFCIIRWNWDDRAVAFIVYIEAHS